jgi:hypothetical protein
MSSPENKTPFSSLLMVTTPKSRTAGSGQSTPIGNTGYAVNYPKLRATPAKVLCKPRSASRLCSNPQFLTGDQRLPSHRCGEGGVNELARTNSEVDINLHNLTCDTF